MYTNFKSNSTNVMLYTIKVKLTRCHAQSEFKIQDSKSVGPTNSLTYKSICTYKELHPAGIALKASFTIRLQGL